MKIDLGCGRRKPDGYFGIDCQDFPSVDLVCNCTDKIPLPDSCADEIRAFDFLEHIDNHKRIHIMTEIWRLLKPGGIFVSMTPSTDGRGAFQDPTHYSFWNENSFWYYCDDAHRALYDIKAKFDAISVLTGAMNGHQICYVHATLRASK